MNAPASPADATAGRSDAVPGTPVTAAMPVPFRLELMGRFELSGPGGPIDLGSRKLCGLMAVLASSASVAQPRERLMALLWGSHSETQARQNLRKAISRLRHLTAADIFLAVDDRLQLRPGMVDCDLGRFERLLAEGSAEARKAAVDLYRDEFLSGLTIKEEGWHQWLSAERDRLEQLAVDALIAVSDDALHEGRPLAAAEFAGRAIALDELREDAHRLVMRGLASAGRRTEALKHGERLAVLLKRELDVEPEEATARLLIQLRRGTVRMRDTDPPEAIPAPVEQGRDLVMPPEVPAGASFDTDRPAGASLEGHEGTGGATAAAGVREALVAAARLPTLRGGGDSALPSRGRAAALLGPAVAACGAAALALGAAYWLPAWTAVPASQSPSEQRSAGGAPYPALPVNTALHTPPGRPSHHAAVAVLPITVAADAGSVVELTAAQIGENLGEALARNANLQVVPREATDHYRGRSIDVFAAAANLGVRYVVTGRWQPSADRARLDLLMTDAAQRRQIWSEALDHRLVEWPGQHREAIGRIARALHTQIVLRSADEAGGRDYAALSTEDLIARGWALIMRGATRAGSEEAEAVFQEVLRRAPDRRPAMIGLAAYYVLNVSAMTIASEPHLEQAEALLRQAMVGGAHIHSVHYYSGILHHLRGDSAGALQAFDRCLEIDPNHAHAHAYRGRTLMRLGRFDEALAEIRQAFRISPTNPAIGAWHRWIGIAELELGRDRNARASFQESEALVPASLHLSAYRAALHALSGEEEAARTFAADLRSRTPQLSDRQRLRQFAGLADDDVPRTRLARGLQRALGIAAVD